MFPLAKSGQQAAASRSARLLSGAVKYRTVEQYAVLDHWASEEH
jgi:hypothetical protein